MRDAKNLETQHQVDSENVTDESANLANVDVRALRVDLRVVEVQDRRVETIGECDGVASVVLLHDVCLGAVLALSAEAESLTGLKVRARLID